MSTTDVEALLARFVEHHVLHGERLSIGQLCQAQPDLAAPLQRLIDRYLSISETLGAENGDGAQMPAAHQALPQWEGFQTIERIGAGGMGEVFKLKDLRLDRLVAAKVVRADRKSGWRDGMPR